MPDHVHAHAGTLTLQIRDAEGTGRPLNRAPDQTLLLAPRRGRVAEPMATLLRHHKVVLEDQVVYATGSAYIDCEFICCTIVFKGFPLHMNGCKFSSCVCHIDFVLHDQEEQWPAFRQLVDEVIAKSLPLADKTADQGPATKIGF